jgi:probable HAF family extracellular repeat protein
MAEAASDSHYKGNQMNVKLFNASLLTACVVLTSASPASANGYTFSDLGTLGGLYSSATAINNVGQIVGWSDTAVLPWPSISRHATLWNDGAHVTYLGTLGGDQSNATGINDSGQVVGWGYTTDNKYMLPITWDGGTTKTTLNTFGLDPFFGGQAIGINSTGQMAGHSGGTPALWNGTTLTTLDGVGGFGSGGIVNAINDAGEMVGFVSSGAARWDGTTLTQLDRLLGSIGSGAYAINNSGQIVGYDDDGIITHAVMWSGTTETVLNPLYSGGISVALGNNDAGQIVGESIDNTGNAMHATIWNGTTPTDLNSYLDAAAVDAGWVLRLAIDINNSGWIVGEAYNNNLGIGMHAFVLADHAYVTLFPPVTVVPEPETYAMFMAGLGLLGFIARRRKNNQS